MHQISYTLYFIFGACLFLFIIGASIISVFGYKIYKGFRDNPDLEDDPHWDNGFTSSWYAQKFDIEKSTASAFLNLSCKMGYFSKEVDENKITLYKMVNLDKRK